LAGGTIAVAASPAQAAPPTVTIDSVSSTTIGAGDKITLRYTVTAPDAIGGPPGDVQANVGGMDCTGDCSPQFRLNSGQSEDFEVTLTAGPVDAGETKTVRVQVSARLNNETGNATRNITVRGPEKPKQVRQISGRVKDSDGKAVSGAQVLMKDSAGHQYDTTSNGDGGYEFTSSDDRPIAPGTVSIGAAKEGYEPAAVNVRASADKTVTVALTLVSKNAPSPSASPSAAEKSAEPLDDATDDAEEPTEAPAVNPDNAANNTDDDSGSMLFIILGGLLVAAGIGAIVLVLMRRKGDGDDVDGDQPSGVVPPSQGRYGDDATRVAAPVGGRANDATMVAGLGAAPSLSDAPTMLHRAVPADEFPDPYGAPVAPPQAGAYGAPAGAGAYGGASAYGGYPEQEQQYGGYGAATGTYGAAAAPPQRYDEPTGMYRPADEGGYGGGYAQPEPEYPPAGRARPEPTGAAGYQGGGYEQHQPADQGGYGGGWSNAGDGIDNGNAYGAGSAYGGYPEQEQQYGGYGAPAGGGTYGAPAGGGYDDGGYAGDQGGYDPRATYGRPDGYERGPEQGGGAYGGGQPGNYGGTYGAPAGGGYEGGGYGGEQGGGGRHGGPRPQESGHPVQRRSLDWLDD
jgi:hypothetical protein